MTTSTWPKIQIQIKDSLGPEDIRVLGSQKIEQPRVKKKNKTKQNKTQSKKPKTSKPEKNYSESLLVWLFYSNDRY